MENQAAKLHAEGYNCAQSVLLSLREECGVSKEFASRMACCFSAGMRCGELCGTLVGGGMAIGLCLGNEDAADIATRDRAYRLIEQLGAEFKERFGTLRCEELLKQNPVETHEEQRAVCRRLYVDFVGRRVREILDEAKRDNHR